MTTASERHKLADIARLRKVLDDKAAHPFEIEAARKALDKLMTPPVCKWCLEAEAKHNGAVCRVLDRFRRKCGKATFPTETQAAEIRQAIVESEKAELATERRKDLRGRQGSLF